VPWTELITLLIMDAWHTLTGRGRSGRDADEFLDLSGPGRPDDDDRDRDE